MLVTGRSWESLGICKPTTSIPCQNQRGAISGFEKLGAHPMRFLSGFLASEQNYNPLISALPKFLKIDFH
jgi:hypothetical protein